MSDPVGESAPAEGPAAHAARTSSTRHKSRKRALDIVFEAELRGTDMLDTLTERTKDADPPVREYTAELVRGVVAHREAIDTRIAAALASGWTLARLPRVDRNALRLAVYEIDYTAVPNAVAVSEAVQLVSQLSTDESPAFVNGVLRSVAGTAVA